MMPVDNLCGGGFFTIGWLSAYNGEDVERKGSVWKEGHTSQDSYDVDNDIVGPEAGDKDSHKQKASGDWQTDWGVC